MMLWGIVFFGVMCLTTVAIDSVSALPGGSVRYDRGLLTISERDVPFMTLLDKISREANLDIYVVDRQLPRNVSLNIVDKPVDDTLRMLLRGCSYAVVYDAFEPRSMVVPGGQYADAGQRVTLLNMGSGGGGARAVSHNAGSRDVQRSQQHHASSTRAPVRGGRSTYQSPSQTAATRVHQAQSSGTSTGGGGAWAYYQGSDDNAAAGTGSGGAAQYASNSYAASETGGGAQYIRTSGGTNSNTSSNASGNDNDNGYNNAPDDDNTGYDAGYDNAPDDDNYNSGDYDDGESKRCRQYCSERYMLENRIASGQSDRYYNKWAEIRGEEYVTHDRDRLEYIEGQISQSSCGC